MKTLRFIFGDQLSRSISSLRDANPASDVVLMVEARAEATHVQHHQQKIAFVLSAMRHFAGQLRCEGFEVDYVRLDDPANTQDFTGELRRALARHRATGLVLTAPSEWRVAEMVGSWRESLGIPVEERVDERFICSIDEFRAWAGDRKQLRMEFFYREMRRKTGLLMDGEAPLGGAWNFDHDNRKRLPASEVIPERLRCAPDEITQQVLQFVGESFPEHFGRLAPFHWAVTREGALAVLEHFVTRSLAKFGDYQDAFKDGEDFLFHSVLSPYLNFGLLTPMEVCEAVQSAYRQDQVPLNAAEGFIRQIIGWREFVRGVYWLRMPDYAASNFLGAHRPLPGFFWSGDTTLNCLKECIRNTRENAYAHHIQRLMVIGNFALMTDVAPAEIEEWFLIVYADALEWVELPNVHGMVMHADAGLLASKPYLASGAYIKRMSNYCSACRYDPDVKLGAEACPFNHLYWNFLMEKEQKLARNPRLTMPYRSLARMSREQKEAIQRQSREFLDQLY